MILPKQNKVSHNRVHIVSAIPKISLCRYSFRSCLLSTMVGESEPDYGLFTLGTTFTNID